MPSVDLEGEGGFFVIHGAYTVAWIFPGLFLILATLGLAWCSMKGGKAGKLETSS